ncbi:ATP-dependent RNA helicase DDX24 [Onthophagus taurus]|uniref:ATP-dependent RNA helicase DDX24 n=1 Tax=Onthophagus taurus TaxID=166361 RepID=UPI0039BEC0B7
MNKLKCVNWKPVKIDGNLCANLDGLIGIEECTDYDLGASLKPKAFKSKHKLNTKNKASKKIKKSINEDEECDLKPSTTGSTQTDLKEFKEKNKINLDIVKAWNTVPLQTPLLKALAIQNFTQPTEIQSLTLPAAILGRRDILGAAETGSGKTLAFGLPILNGILHLKQVSNKEDDESDFDEVESEVESLDENGFGCVKSINNISILNDKEKPLYALILTPTRELAIQIKNHLVSAAQFTTIRIAVVVGGMSVEKQERILSKGPEIVIATPGRLWNLLEEGNQHLNQIDNIKFLAIDETDRMIEKGHFQELGHILERLNMDEMKRKARQNFVFSATLTLIHELPKHLLVKRKVRGKKNISDMTPDQKLQSIVDILGISNPKVVDITKGKGTPQSLTESKITCSIDEKDYYVYYFLKQYNGRTLIFCNSIGCVKRLVSLLGLLDCKPLPLHASMQQRQRLKNLDKFKSDENGLLIATDVAARGLDIPSVQHVLHYQTPRTSESYVHRSGRTARATKEGLTVLLVEPDELQNYLRLCRTLGKTEDIPQFPIQDSILNAVKQTVNLARELDKLELQVKKTNSESGWMQKAAEEMDIIFEEESCKYDKSDANKLKKVADIKRKELMVMLKKPLFPKNMVMRYPLFPSNLDFLDKKPINAIETMKNCLENSAPIRKKAKRLFKTKIENMGSVNKLKINGNKGGKIKKRKR